ncbi:MAG: M48 family metalloprotease [Proteobacteria bacterium]|nr:M48 family metalloprotease [Pseudomonadota bacterium]MBU1584510.1 M48 family metalloprotease [Pseudomonadota bacterium]MBU2454751.1 M48 family metalloprotease [Pseudomonadota bacterium]MBU2627280.1 M48 family metalloprotease [Pseudomonadota bacterium]
MKETTRRNFLFVAGNCAAAGFLLAGCKTMEAMNKMMDVVSVDVGPVSSSQAQSLIKVGQAVAKTFESFTPEQEYYIGRTIGAMVLQKYPAFDSVLANTYINVMGQTLAAASDRPDTFAGYRFQIQDSEEINAFAAPGGFVFVTRGLIRCCKDEDSLAAVLAHEIGHIQGKHGLQAIKQSRITHAVTTLGLEGAKQLGGKEISALTQTFEESISDITNTLIVNGYSRIQEKEADLAAVEILNRVGYSPHGLIAMLNQMQTRLKPGTSDFARTHPLPEDRIQALEPVLGSFAPYQHPRPRLLRFNTAISWI